LEPSAISPQEQERSKRAVATLWSRKQHFLPGGNVALRVSYQGNDVVVDEGSTLLIGAGEASQIRIARPGISRRHAVVAYDGVNWKVEDAGSRNGTFLNGEKIHVTPLDGPTTLVLGHPTEGEEVTFTPIVDAGVSQEATLQADIDAFVLPDSPPPAPARSAAPVAAATAAAARPTPRTASESDDLIAAIRDQIQAVKGLTWSVWAMIAVTAALCVLTLFVGILGA
jgi:hypothetical protein